MTRIAATHPITALLPDTTRTETLATYGECNNCGEVYPETADLAPISDLTERVMPGEPMPLGECPACGALVSLIERHEYPILMTVLSKTQSAARDAATRMIDAVAEQDDHTTITGAALLHQTTQQSTPLTVTLNGLTPDGGVVTEIAETTFTPDSLPLVGQWIATVAAQHGGRFIGIDATVTWPMD